MEVLLSEDILIVGRQFEDPHQFEEHSDVGQLSRVVFELVKSAECHFCDYREQEFVSRNPVSTRRRSICELSFLHTEQRYILQDIHQLTSRLRLR